mmetsp:Transcript_75284/g.121542  ORF Transcript_75284/g.121542 Transcript_75284/m.121542 type:complete len:173 (-) Transcript_75284:6-524(-)
MASSGGHPSPAAALRDICPVTSLLELKTILAAWAGFGVRTDCFGLAAPFLVRGSNEQSWSTRFGRESRTLPKSVSDETTLAKLVELMSADSGYAGVGPCSLAVFAQRHRCPTCGAAGALSFGREASQLAEFGGSCSLEDCEGRVVYQLGARAQCGSCWLAERTVATGTTDQA